MNSARTVGSASAFAAAVEGWRHELSGLTGPRSLSTGFGDMDDLLFGLRPGRLYIVGGRPGAGTSALVLGMASTALESGRTVLLRSLDTAADDIVLRLIAREARVSLPDIQTRNLEPDDWASWRRLYAATDRVAEFPLVIDDGGDGSEDLVKQVRFLVEERGNLGLVVVDDLQRLTLMERRSTVAAGGVRSVLQRLRVVARDADVPVIACAQSVLPTRRKDLVRPPEIGDLRDADAIASNADVILLLAATEAGQGPGLVQLEVAKNRNGHTGKVTLAFLDHLLRFASVAWPA